MVWYILSYHERVRLGQVEAPTKQKALRLALERRPDIAVRVQSRVEFEEAARERSAMELNLARAR